MGEESIPSYDVFLSYSSQDKTWADAACAVLERHGVRCWIAPRDIIHGDEWGAAIIKGINGSRMMVLIFSGHANASGQVHREVERAISRGIAVLPIRVEDVLPEGAMEFALGNRHWLDAFTPPFERQLEALAQSVKSLLGHAPGANVGGPASLPAGGLDREPVVPVPPVARRPGHLIRLAAVLAVMLTVSVFAGWLARSWDRTVPPIAEAARPTAEAARPTAEAARPTAETVKPIIGTAPQSDEDRIQGRWQGVELALPPGIAKKKGMNASHEATRTFWTFRGRTLTISVREDGEDQVRNRGSFSLSKGAERKFFDYATTVRDDQAIAFAGIYEFDGEYLRVCYGVRVDPANQPAESRRPDSFIVPGTGFRRNYLKLKRVGD